MYDLILKNALVLDGGGGPGVHADVAVSGGYIAAVDAAKVREFGAGNLEQILGKNL